MIDQAGSSSTQKLMIETGLIACNSGVDIVVPTLPPLPHDVRIVQEGTGCADQAGVPPLQHLLVYGGIVDEVGSK